MDQKVRLKHPQGKKPISMSKEKYDLLKPVVLKYLLAKGKATFSEISSAIIIEKSSKQTGQNSRDPFPGIWNG